MTIGMSARVRHRSRVLAAVVVVGLLGPVAAACTPDRDPPPTGPTGSSSAPPSGVSVAPPEAGPDAGLSAPVADPLYPQYGNPALDVLRYSLVLSWAPEQRLLTGTATLTVRAVRPVRELSLDFSDAYTVDGATVDGAPAQPGRRGNDIVVPIGRQLPTDTRAMLVVRYSGTPRTVPMPSGRGDFPEGVGLRAAAGGEVWTMQEPYGAFTWYPANDHPSDEAVYDVAVTVPKGWAGVAHGQLIRVETGAAGDTYHWRAVDPVASYLATLAAGRYTRVDDTGPRGLPITYWVRTGKDEDMLPVVRRSPEMLDWLEDRFGPYPFPTAGVVLVNSISAMETQQMVTLGAGTGDEPLGSGRIEAYSDVLLHEYAHQWFGDTITPTNWRGMWLNEGWAMYAQWLWSVDHGDGTDGEWVKWAFGRDGLSRPVAGPPGNPHPDHFGENNVYVGPALMLHEIHHTIGDQAFFALARDWVQTQRNQQVDRARFVAFVNRHTGRNFTALINNWLDSPTTPAPS
jgi:aminopeptidase N